MEKYELKIESLLDDVDGIVTLYSKGHHDKVLFKEECLKELNPNWDRDRKKIYNLKSRFCVHWYAKKVGFL